MGKVLRTEVQLKLGLVQVRRAPAGRLAAGDASQHSLSLWAGGSENEWLMKHCWFVLLCKGLWRPLTSLCKYWWGRPTNNSLLISLPSLATLKVLVIAISNSVFLSAAAIRWKISWSLLFVIFIFNLIKAIMVCLPLPPSWGFFFFLTMPIFPFGCGYFTSRYLPRAQGGFSAGCDTAGHAWGHPVPTWILWWANSMCFRQGICHVAAERFSQCILWLWDGDTVLKGNTSWLLEK